MRVVLIIIFILVLLFFQIGVFPGLAIVKAYPNLILLAILSLSIFRGWKKVLPWTIVGGLFLDLYSLHGVLGISVIGLLFVSYLVYFLSQNIFKKNDWLSLIVLFLINILAYNICSIILLNIFATGFDFRFLTFFIGLIYNLIFSLPVFWLIKIYVHRIRKIQG